MLFCTRPLDKHYLPLENVPREWRLAFKKRIGRLSAEHKAFAARIDALLEALELVHELLQQWSFGSNEALWAFPHQFIRSQEAKVQP